MDKARAANMPADNIKRAIDKAVGGNAAEQYEEIVYEGYGPGGVAILVEAATDNKNRTAADVRAVFTKAGGQLAGGGCSCMAVRAARRCRDHARRPGRGRDRAGGDRRRRRRRRHRRRPDRGGDRATASSKRCARRSRRAGVPIESAELDDAGQDADRGRRRTSRARTCA